MGHAPPSTPAQRAQRATYLLAHAGDYGVITALSRASGVSRPTLYAWRAQTQLGLWELYVRRVCWTRVVLDGGTAMQAACWYVTPEVVLQHDQRHMLHTCPQLHARLERRVTELRARTAMIARQAVRVAAGQKPQRRNPQTEAAAHVAAGASPYHAQVQRLHMLLRAALPTLLTFAAAMARVYHDLQPVLPPTQQGLLA